MLRKITMLVNDNCNARRFNVGLMSAIKKKKIIEFKSILNGAEDNPQDALDYTGASLLHVAAENGSEDITTYLISLGLNVNLQDIHGRTALMIALKKYHFKTAITLLQSKSDVQICNDFGCNALRIAIEIDPIAYSSGFVLCIKHYWEVIAMILDKLDDDCQSNYEQIADILLQMICPLTHVVFMRSIEVMKIMLEKGCPINRRCHFDGLAALHLAVQYWKPDRVELLLNYNADFNILDYYGRTPFMLIYDREMPICEVELIRVLLKHKSKMYTLDKPSPVRQMQDLFEFGSKEAIKLALEIDENLLLAKDDDGIFLLLKKIIRNENPGMVDVIRGKKIDLNYYKTCDWTALGETMQAGNYEIAEYLLSIGANPNLLNNHQGINPMHLIILHGRENPDRQSLDMDKRMKCMRLSLEFGGDPDILVLGSSTIFDLISLKEASDFAESILAQYAIREIMGISISDKIRQQFETNEVFKKYFDSRVNELENAKSSVIYRSVSVFEFLTKSDISFYSRNRGLVTKLKNLIDRLEMDLYYVHIIRRRISIVSEMAKLREQAENIVCQNVGKFYEWNPVVTRLIVDFLDDEDVKKLLSINQLYHVVYE